MQWLQLSRLVFSTMRFQNMSKIEDFTNGVIDNTSELIEKVSSPASRSGSVVERVGTMCEEGVDLDVIALQMTKNSPNAKTYTIDDVKTCSKIYQDSKTKVVMTSKQARALIKDQHKIKANCDELAQQF